jgi:Arc/MetJ-type ribon-helix-helix transcriptional regulator
MPKSKIAITIDPGLLAQVDALVAAREFPNRSQAVEAALVDALAHRVRARLAMECAKLDPGEERTLAEEGIGTEGETWPEY